MLALIGRNDNAFIEETPFTLGMKVRHVAAIAFVSIVKTGHCHPYSL